LALDDQVEVLTCPQGWTGGSAWLEDARPDVVFLRLPVPQEEAADFLRRLTAPGGPAIIALADRTEHALAAFDLRALDCLMEPVDPERVRRSLQRVRSRLGQRLAPPRTADFSEAGEAASTPRRVPIRVGDRVLFLHVNQIDWVEADNNHVILHTASEAYKLRQTLQETEAALSSGGFIRVNRSALANVARIAELRSAGGGKNLVILHDGSRLTTRRALRDLQRQVVARQGDAPGHPALEAESTVSAAG